MENIKKKYQFSRKEQISMASKDVGLSSAPGGLAPHVLCLSSQIPWVDQFSLPTHS